MIGGRPTNNDTSRCARCNFLSDGAPRPGVRCLEAQWLKVVCMFWAFGVWDVCAFSFLCVFSSDGSWRSGMGWYAESCETFAPCLVHVQVDIPFSIKSLQNECPLSGYNVLLSHEVQGKLLIAWSF